jgi:hypothetical protein
MGGRIALPAGVVCREILGGSAWLAAALAIVGGAACSDPAECQSAASVAFDPITESASATGGPIDVHLHSSLSAGDTVTLEIDDASNAVVATLSAPVADDGSVTFSGVTLPAGAHATLKATGEGTCGIGRDQVAISGPVGGGGLASNAACVLTLDPAPEANPYYLALGAAGVLSTLTDPDPATPGYQSTVQVATAPGWSAELFAMAPATAQQPSATPVSLGRATADAGGVATQSITVMDGSLGLMAVCHGPAAQAVPSATTLVVADTTPPACAIESPPPGSTITQRFNDKPIGKKALTKVELAFTAHADDGDIEAEPVTLSYKLTGASKATLAAMPNVADGSSKSMAITLGASKQYEVALTMRDHAGNVCASDVTYDVKTTGCDIAVTSPTTITSDADGNPGNGAQANVTVQVSPQCAGQKISGTCGLSEPSSFAGTNGLVTFTTELCAVSPCKVETTCVFHVTAMNGVDTQVAVPISFDNTGA